MAFIKCIYYIIYIIQTFFSFLIFDQIKVWRINETIYFWFFPSFVRLADNLLFSSSADLFSCWYPRLLCIPPSWKRHLKVLIFRLSIIQKLQTYQINLFLLFKKYVIKRRKKKVVLVTNIFELTYIQQLLNHFTHICCIFTKSDDLMIWWSDDLMI